MPNRFVLDVELNGKLLVVVAGVPKLLMGFPNNPVDPDWLVVPNPPVIEPNAATNEINLMFSGLNKRGRVSCDYCAISINGINMFATTVYLRNSLNKSYYICFYVIV